MKNFNIIVAVEKNNGIGKDGVIPWKSPEDMRYFKHITSTTKDENKVNAVIMGRHTFESLNNKPLNNRLNVVITSRDYDEFEDILAFTSLEEALEMVSENEHVEDIYIIGGEQLYSEAIEMDNCEDIFLNRINTEAECDCFFPEIDLSRYNHIWDTVANENLTCMLYKNKNFI